MGFRQHRNCPWRWRVSTSDHSKSVPDGRCGNVRLHLPSYVAVLRTARSPRWADRRPTRVTPTRRPTKSQHATSNCQNLTSCRRQLSISCTDDWCYTIVLCIGVTTLCDPSDAFSSTLENLGTKCILSPPIFLRVTNISARRLGYTDSKLIHMLASSAILPFQRNAESRKGNGWNGGGWERGR